MAGSKKMSREKRSVKRLHDALNRQDAAEIARLILAGTSLTSKIEGVSAGEIIKLKKINIEQIMLDHYDQLMESAGLLTHRKSRQARGNRKKDVNKGDLTSTIMKHGVHAVQLNPTVAQTKIGPVGGI